MFWSKWERCKEGGPSSPTNPAAWVVLRFYLFVCFFPSHHLLLSSSATHPANRSKHAWETAVRRYNSIHHPLCRATKRSLIEHNPGFLLPPHPRSFTTQVSNRLEVCEVRFCKLIIKTRWRIKTGNKVRDEIASATSPVKHSALSRILKILWGEKMPLWNTRNGIKK